MSSAQARGHKPASRAKQSGPALAWEQNRIDRFYRALLIMACLTIGCAGAVVLLWLWIYDGGLTDINGIGSSFTSFGRLTGLLAGYILVIQVLLLIRLPFLEWIAGFDRLTRIHRIVGKTCLYLIVAHIVAVTIGYAATGHTDVVREFGLIIANYYGMVVALVGTVIILAVIVTSYAIVRGRLPYETWFAVHLLAYAGITLTWFHESPTGLDFIRHPWAASLWLGIYLLTLQLFIVFRILQPALRFYLHRLKVVEVTPEGGGVISIRIGGRHLDWLEAQPGQFFIWRFLTRGRWWQAHPFSLSAVPDGKSFRISAKAVGDFTRDLSSLRPQTSVLAEGPFGQLTAATQTHQRVLLVAGGIGITPLRALAERMTGEVILIYRAMSEDELVFREELEKLAAKRNFKIHYVVGDHRLVENRRLLDPAHLLRLVPDIQQRDVYLSGPPGMVEVLRRHLRDAGVPSVHIHSEQFALG